MNARIAILGAGPAGLTLARLLQMRGATVTVFEQAPSARTRLSGGSLDIDARSGGKALQAAGLDARLRCVARPEASGYTIADAQGTVVLRIPALPSLLRRPEVDRDDLRRLLLEALARGTVRWGHRLEALERRDAGGYRLRFEQAADEPADLVIGADGVHSRVRPWVTTVVPHYAGVSLLHGEVAAPEQVCPDVLRWMAGGNLFALADGKGVMAQRRGDGVLVCYLTQKVPPDWAASIAAMPHDARERTVAATLAGWHPAFHALFRAAPALVPHALQVTPADHTWNAHSDITLIGDAAHALTPFGGEGANMAMLDALVLANSLTVSPHDRAAAIHRYEQNMFARTGKVQHATQGLLEVFHGPQAARNVTRVFLGPFAPVAKPLLDTASRIDRLLGKFKTRV